MGQGAGPKFFRVSPFDPARFAALSEGLEIATIPASNLERTLRIDAEFFQARFLIAQKLLNRSEPSPLTDFVAVSDGNHFTISDDFVEAGGIPYFRGQDISGEFFLDGLASINISEAAFERPYMRRSHLKRGDVLLSIVGTIGAPGLIESDAPATCSCKLAILRPTAINPAYLASFLRSKFGAFRIEQLTRGAVQRGLILDDMDQIGVPRFGRAEAAVAGVVNAARQARDAAARTQRAAEEALLDALGLRGWSPPEPLTYACSASTVADAGRLDAQYFMPAKHAVLQRLGALPGKPLDALVDSVRQMFDPRTAPVDALVRNYDLTDALQPLLDDSVAPEAVGTIESQKKIMQHGDLAVSRLRSYLREIAVVKRCDELPIVGSSEFYVLRRKEGTAALSAEALLVYLRSAPVQTVLKWCQDGSQHPRFSEGDLLAVPVPDVVRDMDGDLRSAMWECFALRARSRALLNAAVRAVEIAVEDGEAAALVWLATAREAADAAAA